MNITHLRHIWFGISGAAVLISVVCIAVLGLRLGLDFTGGARWDVRFENAVERPALEAYFADLPQLSKEAVIQGSDENTFLITLEDMPDESIQEIAGGVQEAFGAFEELSYRKVDAKIGASFQEKALWAIGVALAGIILFVAWAFRKIPESINPWRFGAVAVIALFHDVIILVGIFAVLGVVVGMELGLPFLTALLATLGFSVNDTIVILDRIRENIRTQKAHETFADSVEHSIRQTLARSIFTSFSTVLPLLALLVLGAESLQSFVLTLFLGVLIGTYSSIFVAAPLLVTWKNIADARDT